MKEVIKKILHWCAYIGIIAIAAMAVLFIGYRFYQETQFYKLGYQQIGAQVGYQQCVNEVKTAQQEYLDQQKQPNE